MLPPAGAVLLCGEDQKQQRQNQHWEHRGLVHRSGGQISDALSEARAEAEGHAKALPKRILLATDGSDDAALAARAAVDLAIGADAEMHVAHAWQSVPTMRFDAFVRDRLLAEARELLEAQVALLSEAGADVAGAHLREGSAVDEVLDLAGEIGADLVVVGSRGRGPVKRLILGSVSEGVVHHALRPVLVLRGGDEAWPPKRVVVGDDGSEAAGRAASLAAGFGGLFGAKGLVLRAYPELPEVDLEGRALNARMVDDELRQEERKLQERARQLEEYLGVRPRVRLDVGDPAATLIGAAEALHEGKQTLLAVGSRGLGPVGRARLGSVSTKVLRAAKGPVLICPNSRDSGSEVSQD
jgi:nucleotide-binding universal stress UspA family protein